MLLLHLCENALIESLEKDNQTIMTHILTGDSMRQWIFYSSDVQGAVERLREIIDSGVSQTVLEATAQEDSQWEEYLETRNSLNLDGTPPS